MTDEQETQLTHGMEYVAQASSSDEGTAPPSHLTSQLIVALVCVGGAAASLALVYSLCVEFVLRSSMLVSSIPLILPMVGCLAFVCGAARTLAKGRTQQVWDSRLIWSLAFGIAATGLALCWPVLWR